MPSFLNGCFLNAGLRLYKVGRRPDLSADEVRELLAEAAVHMRVDHEDFEAFFRPDCAMLSS